MFEQGQSTWWRVAVCGVLWLLIAATLTSAVRGNINLEWRPAEQIVVEGDTVNIGLYAVSDDETDQCLAAMDVILVWDPVFLELLGVVDNGPYDWLFSGFPDDSGLDGLNDTWLDGDALYTAWAQFGDAAYATPEGLLVTTVQFEALAKTPVSGTELTILEEYGQYTSTRVFDCEVPGLEVTGTLGSANVRILCANGCVGDVDGDCDVDHSDLGTLLADWGCDDPINGCVGDLDGDDKTGHSDLGILLADWGCGVP